MKVDFELTERDHSAISDKIIQRLSDETFMKKVTEVSASVAEKRYWFMFEKTTAEVAIGDLLKKHTSNIILSAIKEGNLINVELNKVINSAEIKKLSANQLREAARRLEKEAEDLLNESETVD